MAIVAAPAGAEAPPEKLGVGPEFRFAPEVSVEARSAPDLAAVPEVLRLPSAAFAAATALAELATQPIAPGTPYRNGFARSGEETLVAVAAGESLVALAGKAGTVRELSGTTVAWAGRFVVEEAHSFRVRLRDVELPEETRIWLEAGDVRLGPYGHELLDPEGGMWLPPVPGAEAIVEIELPAAGGFALSALSFRLGEVMELVPDPMELRLEPQVWTGCDVDATCVSPAASPAIEALREATARLTYVEGDFSYLCTGGLLSDEDPTDFRPYLLTANHCFDTQASASSLVAYFDYRSSTCDGATPLQSSVPSVAGSTLLATGESSDFTFVELSGNPSGTIAYLGWTVEDPTAGTQMYRVSHPSGTKQSHSVSSFVGAAGISACRPVTDFHYSEAVAGSIVGGSSGAPVVNAAGQVLGQLLGACHFGNLDWCNYATFSLIDGAFSTTFPAISSWLTGAACDDAFEPDGSAGEASPIVAGAVQSHSICPAGDEDWVTFALVETSQVTLQTSGASGDDTRMWLYGASGTEEIASDDDGGGGLFSSIERACGDGALDAGTYHVKVDGHAGDDVIAGYDLSLIRTACGGPGCPVELTLSGTTVTGPQASNAAETITLGPDLTIEGSDVVVFAGQRVVITSGTSIGGSFTVRVGEGSCAL